jgi:hypothetical protein
MIVSLDDGPYDFISGCCCYMAPKTFMPCAPAGMITSLDDWYILDSGLVVTETSNDIHDSSLWELVKPQVLSCPC